MEKMDAAGDGGGDGGGGVATAAPADGPAELGGTQDLETVTGMRAAGRRCAECGSGAADKHCSRCKVATYCSLQCQKASWKAVHKANCKPNPTKALVLKAATVFSASAATATAAWMVLPPHSKLPRTREEIAEMICRAKPTPTGTCGGSSGGSSGGGSGGSGGSSGGSSGTTNTLENAVDAYHTPRLAVRLTTMHTSPLCI